MYMPTFVCMHAHMAAINVQGDSVLDSISQATYIRSEQIKKMDPPP